MQFSQNINGLRAIAVLAVLLFHFEVPGFEGGFVGVDVFFVISGYLMSSIILGRIETGGFTLRRFYADRLRRIVPALAVVCVVLLICGWFLLLPSDYRKLGKQVGASLGFVSNILFEREAGYFAGSSQRNWLLHTWSLSVEWQFYMLYPLLLLGLHRLGGMFAIRCALPTLAAASLALCLWQSLYAPNAAFFLLPARAWELLLGGLVFVFPLQPGPRAGRALEASGLLLVLCSALLLGPADPWPGWRALAPTLGTAMVVAARQPASALLSNAPTQWLGQVSYSVYLWHWPLAVGMTQLLDGSAAPHKWIGITLALVVGQLSYRFVETPGRRSTPSAQKARAVRWLADPRALGVAMGLVALGGAAAWASDGVPQRFSQEVRTADLESLNMNPQRRACFATAGIPQPACTLGERGAPVLAEMIGDSHALSLVSALADALPNREGAVVFRGYASCPTLRDATYGPSDNHCEAFNRLALAAALKGDASSPPLVVTNNWTAYLEAGRIRFLRGAQDSGISEPFSAERYRSALLQTACALAQHRRVYLTLPLPRFDIDVPRATAYRLMRDPSAVDSTIDLQQHRQTHAKVVSMLIQARDDCGVHLLDPVPFLCPDGHCRASIGGRPLYTDEHHLSEFGNRQLVPMFREIFSND